MIIFPVGRNLLHNANFANNSYNPTGLSNPADFGLGYRAMDRWQVAFNNMSGGNRDILPGNSSPPLNNKSRDYVSFFFETQASSTIEVSQRIESRDAVDAVKAGKLSMRLVSLQNEFEGALVTLRHPSAGIDNYTAPVDFFSRQVSLNATNTWDTQGIVLEDIDVPPEAIDGIELHVEFNNPLLIPGVREMRLTQWMLNPGPQVQPFELRHFNETMGKLADKRYYQNLRWDRINSELGGDASVASVRLSWMFTLPVPMRAIPTVVKTHQGFGNIRANDPDSFWTVTTVDVENSVVRISMERSTAGWTFISRPFIQFLAEL